MEFDSESDSDFTYTLAVYTHVSVKCVASLLIYFLFYNDFVSLVFSVSGEWFCSVLSNNMLQKRYHGALCRSAIGKLYPEVVASENEWKQMIKMKQAHANYISCLAP